MIKINLLGETTTVDHSTKFMLVGYVASVLLFLVVFFVLSASISSSVKTLTADSQRLQAELDSIKEKTKEVRDLEARKKELNEKLRIIATLKRSKVGPVRVMDDLNNAMPEKAWVLNVKEQGGLLKILGFALDNQTVAQFMTDLEKSNYFEAVELVQVRQTTKNGIGMKEFTIQAKVSYAGQAKPSVATATTADATEASKG